MKLNFKKTEYIQSKFKTGKRTCPVCGRTDDWDCSETLDGGLVYCKYVASAKQMSDDRYEHLMRKSQPDYSAAFNQESENLPENADDNVNHKADAETLDQVYSAFLCLLALNDNHLHNLLNVRGLDEKFLLERLYVSTPSNIEQEEIAEQLASSFNLEGVPGFYQENGRWTFYNKFTGFYIPFRDEQGRIIGLQIRKDIKEKQKFVWFSSRNLEKGTSSGSQVHFVNPECVRKNKIIFITEGALKADCINFQKEAGLAAIAGVHIPPKKLIDSIIQVFPDLERVVIAFDMDWQKNRDVKAALFRLIDALKEKSLAVKVITWKKNLGKGLDDVLLNASKLDLKIEDIFEFIPAGEFQKIHQITTEQETNPTTKGEPNMINDIKEEPENLDMGLQKEVNGKENADTFGICWKDFAIMKLPEPEKVIFGLNRGNYGILNATTNIGKTTLILNMAISMAGDREFYPLINEETVGKRILYIDGEATKSELQADVIKMLERCSRKEQELIANRLCFICDEELNDEPLDLVNEDHLKIVTETALKFKPDLIVVDTLSALTIMEDENDNALIKKEIIQPLKTLAKKANAGVLLLHHKGKGNENSYMVESSYSGRGASAFGALARVNFNLDWLDQKKEEVVLSCSKAKVKKFEAVAIKLDEEARWFNLLGTTAEVKKPKKVSKRDADYKAVINYINEIYNQTGKSAQRGLAVKYFKDKNISRNNVDEFLSQGCEDHLLRKVKLGKYIPYTAEIGE